MVKIQGLGSPSESFGVCEVADVDEGNRSIVWIKEDVLRPEVPHQAASSSKSVLDIEQLQQHITNSPVSGSHQRVEGKQILCCPNGNTPKSLPDICYEGNSAGAFLYEHMILLR